MQQYLPITIIVTGVPKVALRTQLFHAIADNHYMVFLARILPQAFRHWVGSVGQPVTQITNIAESLDGYRTMPTGARRVVSHADLQLARTSVELPDHLAHLPADQIASRRLVHEYTEAQYDARRAAGPIVQQRIEVEMSVLVSDLEPHVADASQILALKGYLPHFSGFSNLLPDCVQGNDDREPLSWHVISHWEVMPTPAEIRIIESVPGARYDAYSNGIFVSATGRTLAEIKQIFDDVARRLPDRSTNLRRRALGCEQALTLPKHHCVLSSDVHSKGRANGWTIEKYLEQLYAHLGARSPVTKMVYARERDAQVVLRQAILQGEAVLCGQLFPGVTELLSQTGPTVLFNGEYLTCHPGFRCVLLLDAAEATAVRQVHPALPMFDTSMAQNFSRRIVSALCSHRGDELSDAQKSAVCVVPRDPVVMGAMEAFYRRELSLQAMVDIVKPAFQAALLPKQAWLFENYLRALPVLEAAFAQESACY